MANWKKVIVSGSNAELNHISASDGAFSSNRSASISASGGWFGDLPETEDQTYIVTYDTESGQFKNRLLSDFPGFG
tara:strand:+ start:1442 stop:1669 length:228 start_codon:yes stop_codon:yes gene_type:complete